MRTHFHLFPIPEDGDVEQAQCGTMLGDGSELSSNWAYVDCRSCLKRKDQISAAFEVEQAAIVEQMGDMAAFMKQEADNGQ